MNKKICTLSFFTRLWVIVLLVWAFAQSQETIVEIPNASFERVGGSGQIVDWTRHRTDRMSMVTGESPVLDGSRALRILDTDGRRGVREAGSDLKSKLVLFDPVQKYKFNFKARAFSPSSNEVGVIELWYYDHAKVWKGKETIPLIGLTGTWKEFSLEKQSPEGTGYMQVWIHSHTGATATIDLDSISLSKINESTPSGRSKPAYIILKLDDLNRLHDARDVTKDRVHPNWVRVVEWMISQNINAGLGLICNSLEKHPETNYGFPKYIQTIKNWLATGKFEIWFHAYDHQVYKAPGSDLPIGEFVNRTYGEQMARFVRSQQLVTEKLGVTMQVFGPPGGGHVVGSAGTASYDLATLQVLSALDQYVGFLSPHAVGEYLSNHQMLSGAGILSLYRGNYSHGLEKNLNIDYDHCIAGYLEYPDKEYFVLQGHPVIWNTEEKFNTFKRIIQYLKSDHAIFVTPSEYIRIKNGE